MVDDGEEIHQDESKNEEHMTKVCPFRFSLKLDWFSPQTDQWMWELIINTLSLAEGSEWGHIFH